MATPDEAAFDWITRHFREHNVHFNATITVYGYYGTRESDLYADWANAQQYLSPICSPSSTSRTIRRPTPASSASLS